MYSLWIWIIMIWRVLIIRRDASIENKACRSDGCCSAFLDIGDLLKRDWLCSFCPEAKNKTMSSVEPQMSDLQWRWRCEKASEWIRVIQYQTNLQTFRYAERSLCGLWLAGGCCHMTPPTPPTPSSCLRKPLPDESPLPGGQKKENGGKTSRAGGSSHKIFVHFFDGRVASCSYIFLI